MRMKQIHKDRILGIFLLAVSLFFFVFTLQQEGSNFEGDPGPRFFPYLGCLITALCGVIVIVKPEKKEHAGFLTKQELKRAAILFGLYALFLVLFWAMGFVVAVPVVLFAVSLLFSKVSKPDASLKSRLIKSAVYALIVAAALYLLYITALKTQFPHGALWQLFS